MNFRSRRSRETLHLDLTPMIDVVFQLVLFLLLSTTFKKPDEGNKSDRSPGIAVDLPRSSSDVVISENRDLDVWVAGDGAIYLDDKPTDNQALRQVFRDAARNDPTTLVIIKADKGVSHGRVVAVMDLARNQGLSRLAIATENR